MLHNAATDASPSAREEARYEHFTRANFSCRAAFLPPLFVFQPFVSVSVNSASLHDQARRRQGLATTLRLRLVG